MYSAVYKCVCKHQAERLYADLIQHITKIISSWSQDLIRAKQLENEVTVIRKFHDVLQQYTTAMGSIVPIFIYLVRRFLNAQFCHNH